MVLDLIASIGGLVIPPAFDFIKKKFITADSDNPAATLSSLAVTKPEIMPEYTNSLSMMFDSKVKYFNRDVIGDPSRWVVNLRASIRPCFVIMCATALIIAPALSIDIPQDIRLFMEINISSWFGSRIK